MAFILALLTGLNGCGKSANSTAPASSSATTPIEVADGTGRTFQLSAEPKRIVSLSPAATQILLTVGAGPQLAGVTRYCVVPADLETKVTRVGGIIDPNYEQIAALKPDLVIAPFLADKTMQDRLGALDLTVAVMHLESLQGVLDDIRMIGHATGHDRAGDATARIITTTITLAAGRLKDVPAEKRPRVLIRMGESSPAPGSYVDDILTAAGGRNALPSGGKAWIEVTPESILQLAPDIIVEISDPDSPTETPAKNIGPGNSKTIPGNARVITLAAGGAFYHPGPTVGPAIWALARSLYPGRFPEPAIPLADQ